MKQIDTHGLKIVGLEEASKNTENYGRGSAKYDEIFYDMETGEVWTRFQCSLGNNSWTVYHDPAVIKVGETSRHLSMQRIADLIYDAVYDEKMAAAEMSEYE